MTGKRTGFKIDRNILSAIYKNIKNVKQITINKSDEFSILLFSIKNHKTWHLLKILNHKIDNTDNHESRTNKI